MTARRFVVEVRAKYEVEAGTPDDALRAVLPLVGRDSEERDIEFFVHEKRDAKMSITTSDGIADPHGLDKPLYTIQEAAARLHASKNAMYEHAHAGTIQTIRLGTRIRIPRKALIDVLNGNVSLSKPEPPISPPPRRSYVRRALEPQIVQQDNRGKRATKEVQKSKELLSVMDVAAALKISAAKVRQLQDERKLYFVQMSGKRLVPPRALEIFSEGRPPIDMVEENIKYCREKYPIEEHTERIERELREAWS